MTIPSQPGPYGQLEYSTGELTRCLARVEGAIGDLRNEVVSRGVYEVERRGIEADIAELRVQAAEDRAASLLRHERLVARTWWVVATVAGLVLTLAGLIITLARGSGKG